MIAAVWPVAFFFVMTFVMTYPLITGLTNTTVYGITADADVSRWDLWWVKTSLLDHHANPFYTDMLYYPYRSAGQALPLYYHTLQPLNGFLALPVLLLTDAVTGPTLAYNLLMILHFALSGLAMFWLVRYLTGSAPGALVAGFIYTFGPFHQYHLHEAQLELVPLEWLPLCVLFVHRLLYRPEGERPRKALAAGSVLCLVASALTSWYLTIYAIVAVALLALLCLWERPQRRRSTLLLAGAVLGLWLVIVSPFLYATVKAASDSTFDMVSGLDYEARFSLSPFDLVTPDKDVRMSPPVWELGPLGYVAMLLGLVGAWRQRRKAAYWLILFGVGVVFALGPYLRVGDAIDVAHTTGVPLPYYFLRNLPFLTISRVPRRFILLADLSLAVLAGFGVRYLLAVVRARAERLRVQLAPQVVQSALVAVLLLVIGLEFATLPQPTKQVYISPYFSKLAQDTSSKAILEMPVTSHYLRDHERMLMQTVHHKKIIGGYVARRVKDYYLDENSPFYSFIELDTRPKRDILPPVDPFAVLNYYSIHDVVFYKDDESYERPGDRPRVEAYLKYIFRDTSSIVYDDQQLTAYKVPQTPPGQMLAWAGSGWYPPETDDVRTWRWSKGKGDLQLINPVPAKLHLKFSSATLRDKAHLSVLLNGKQCQTFSISNDPQPFDAGDIELPAGENRITFSSDTPPVNPSQAGIAPGDRRDLAFQVGDLSLR